MKIIAIIAASIMLATSAVNGSIASGACPTLTTLDFNANWRTDNVYYLHYIDKLVDNGYTLYNLIVNSQYITADCLGMAGGHGMDNATYVSVVAQGVSGQLPGYVGVTWNEDASNTLIL